MMPPMRAILLSCLALAACSSPPANSSTPDLGGADLGADGGQPPTSPLVLARPYLVDVPDGWYNDRPLPLIVLLHGYGAGGFVQMAYFGFNHLVDDRQVIIAYPDGTLDASGARFWNATDVCCNQADPPIDDVAYLNAVLDDLEAHWKIDPKRVYFVGHSNGGFMSHRMACDAAERIAGIATLAGDNWKDTSKCNPSRPVPVLQIQGDADETVPYLGGGLYPSAAESVAGWAAKDGCTGGLAATGRTIDLEKTLPGAETEVAAWTCPAGSAAELWTIHGGHHMPDFNEPDWGNDLFDWLAQQSR
jgi:polyhydroxybutyrate depolymerase